MKISNLFRISLPALTVVLTLSFVSCGDFKKARSKRIVEKAFEQYALEDMEAALETSDLAVELGSDDPALFALRGSLFYETGKPAEAVIGFQQALKVDPEKDTLQIAWYHAGAAESLVVQGKYAEARDAYDEALKIAPDDPRVLNDFAWLLAVAPDASIRDPKRAVTMSEKSCEISDWSDIAKIDTLAAAHAAAGDFESAVKFQKRAIELMDSSGDFTKEERDQMEFDERLKLFEKGEAFQQDYEERYRLRMLED